MAVYYGAQYNLNQLIKTHLFIISPNNSGSMFLKNALATSSRTWNLAREGQHTYGFAGPSSRASGARLIWASERRWIDLFADSTRYDWSRTRKAWYFQAFSRDPHACVFVTKSPPFLLKVAALKRNFENARFLFMVRNPYATVEGIYRRVRRHRIAPEADLLEVAATHVMTCFRYQRANLEKYGEVGVFFRYEAMCEEPEKVEQSMRMLVPELEDVRLRQRLPVKGLYNEMLQNMNASQIARLSRDDRDRINRVFSRHQDLLAYFQYPLRTG